MPRPTDPNTARTSLRVDGWLSTPVVGPMRAVAHIGNTVALMFALVSWLVAAEDGASWFAACGALVAMGTQAVLVVLLSDLKVRVNRVAWLTNWIAIAALGLRLSIVGL